MADKIVKLVDKNSNNLYPVAGAVIDNAVSTGAISSQAVTNPKIENGAVNGVANDATAIGTAKLALDTVGTPNLRDASVTSDKIDYATYQLGVNQKVGTWFDGKPLYRKVIDFGALPNNSSKSVPHGISTADSVTKVSGTTYSPSRKIAFPLPFVYSKTPGITPNPDERISLLIDDTNVTISTGLDRSGFTQTYIEIYFTEQ